MMPSKEPLVKKTTTRARPSPGSVLTSSFTSKAPREVVAVQEKRQEELREKSEKLQKMIDMLRG